MPWFRIDCNPPSAKTLARAGELAAAADTSWNVRIDDEAVIVALGSESADADALGRLVQALQEILGGRQRSGDSPEALDLDTPFPDEGAGMLLAMYAPEPEPTPVPKGLYARCADWRDGAKTQAGWHTVVDKCRRFVGNERLDALLVRDLMLGWGLDLRGASAGLLLQHQPEPHITAALVERMRRGRGQGRENFSRSAALRSLVRRNVAESLPSLALEAIAEPRHRGIQNLLEEQVRAGALPESLWPPKADMSVLRGWEPFTLEDELARRNYDSYGWIEAEHQLQHDHEAFLATLPPIDTPTQARQDVWVELPPDAADQLLRALPPTDVERDDSGGVATLCFPTSGLPTGLAYRRHYLVLLAAAATRARATVMGPAPRGDVELMDGRLVLPGTTDPDVGAQTHLLPNVSLELFGKNMWRTTTWDRVKLAWELGHLVQVIG